MTSHILVTGGTGTLGRHVVRRFRDADCRVRVLSRRAADGNADVERAIGDLSTGEGVEAAIRGTEVVVHLAGTRTGDDEKARHVVEAASSAGTHHLVFISVVGADRIPCESGIDRAMFGYFASKRAAEEVVSNSGVPWTTLRATQFHDLMLMTARQMAKLPVIPVFSGFRFQPIDTDVVADRLVELALDWPAGLVPDIAGPRVLGMDELVRTYLRAAGKRRAIVPVHAPGKAARAFRGGANLAPRRSVDGRTWEEFLADEVTSARDDGSARDRRGNGRREAA